MRLLEFEGGEVVGEGVVGGVFEVWGGVLVGRVDVVGWEGLEESTGEGVDCDFGGSHVAGGFLYSSMIVLFVEAFN